MPLLFVFDMDDVLYDYDWRARMAGVTELSGHDLDELRRRWWNADGEWKAEAGGFRDADSYRAALAEAIGVTVSDAEWIANRRGAMTAWPESIAAVTRAAELGDVTLLFVFDMDDVLYDYDWRARMAGLTELSGHDVEELKRRWWNANGEWKAEAGGFRDADAYRAALAEAIGVTMTDADWIANRRGAMTAWPESIAAVTRAAELGDVSLLTNNGPLTGTHLAEIVPEIAPLFGDHLRTSSYYGARKPNKVVFQRLLDEYDADPDDVFFTDDLVENVRGAESVGITGHLFTTPAALLEAVEAFAASRA